MATRLFSCLRRDIRDRRVVIGTLVALALTWGYIIPNYVLTYLFEPISLTYDKDTNIVAQRRYVPFEIWLRWDARVEHLNHGATVVCSGGSEYLYDVDDETKPMLLDRWVGEAGCTGKVMGGGEPYQLYAKWSFIRFGITLATWELRSGTIFFKGEG